MLLDFRGYDGFDYSIARERTGVFFLKKTWFSLAVLVVLVGITLFFNLSKSTNTDLNNDVAGLEVKAAKGYVAPDFSITDADGNKVKLSDYKGKPVFINFWASWCDPCREEMPFIEDAYLKYNQDIEFLMINVIESDTRRKMEAFIEEFGLTFPVLLDHKNVVTDRYRISGYPTSFFINKQGVITEKVLGGMSKPMFNQLIHKLLKD